MSLKDQAAIVGIGQLPFSKNIGKSEDVTALEASKIALEDAGSSPSDIDGMVKWSIQTTSENVIARNLGVPNLRFFGEVGYGGRRRVRHRRHTPRRRSRPAWRAASSSTARATAARAGGRGPGRRASATSRGGGQRDRALLPYGFVRPVDQVAMFARRFLHERGYTTRHLGWIAVVDAQARDQQSRTP